MKLFKIPLQGCLVLLSLAMLSIGVASTLPVERAKAPSSTLTEQATSLEDVTQVSSSLPYVKSASLEESVIVTEDSFQPSYAFRVINSDLL